jgi:hypothetical protein
MNLIENIKNLNRRVIFVLMALSVAIPLIFKIGLPSKATKEVKMVYNSIKDLEQGSVVLVSFDHEASSLPEIKPMAEAVLRHCFSKDLKVIGLALLAEGTAIGDEIMREVAKEYGKEYGEDYVFLGFRPQYMAAILGMGEDIHRVFPQDYKGNPTDELTVTKDLKNYEDIPLIISVADGDMPTYWINFAGARYHKRIAIAVTAVMATSFYPFLDSGQLVGLVGGLKGAAEYETLIHKPGMGSKGMDAQSMAHIMILFLVILGNITFFMSKKKKHSR